MKITGITKNELEDLMCHWSKFGQCHKWPTPLTERGRDREEQTQNREIIFFIDNINEVLVKIKPLCETNQYYCARELYYNGRRKAQGL